MAGGRCCACNGPTLSVSSAPVLRASYLVLGSSSSCHNPFGVPSAQRTASPSPRGPSSSSSGSLAASAPGPDSVISSASALPSFEAICRLSVPLLPHIPKGARNNLSGVLSSVLEFIIARPSDLEAWKRLFMLPKCTLALPTSRSRRRSR